MYGIIAGVQVPYALPENDGCKLGINCPINSGSTYTEVEVFPVLKEYPLVRLLNDTI
jgi:Niemann-Pick C2 protein